jgi:hypothetical protein
LYGLVLSKHAEENFFKFQIHQVLHHAKRRTLPSDRTGAAVYERDTQDGSANRVRGQQHRSQRGNSTTAVETR